MDRLSEGHLTLNRREDFAQFNLMDKVTRTVFNGADAQ